MEAPKRCPLLRGNKYSNPVCRFTGENLTDSLADGCDHFLRCYLKCEYFSRWYWGEQPENGLARRKQKRPEAPELAPRLTSS